MKKIFLAFIVITICSCSKDNEKYQKPEQINNNYIVKEVDPKGLIKDLKLNTAFKNLKTIGFKTHDGNSPYVYNEKYNFIINLNKATYIEKGNYHSYTFPIARKNDKVENLVFSLQGNGSYKAILLSYNLTKEEIENIANKTRCRFFSTSQNQLGSFRP